jgi:DNA-binding IclR family transcriptional regulator
MTPLTHGDSGGLQTVARGMQVLRAFRSDRVPVSNAELVRRTGLSKATVSRLTSTLVQLGFLRHVPGSREFELAAGALGIGHAFVATSELLAQATPLMQDLADRLGVSVALAVQDGLDMLYVAYRVSAHVATLRMGQGSVLPMASTAIGRAHLWGLEAGERQHLVSALKRGLGSHWPALEQGIKDSFREMEATGTCAVMGAFQRDAYAIALPLRIGWQGLPMAMSCGKAMIGLNLAAERKRIAPVLRDAAARLEALMAPLDGRP